MITIDGGDAEAKGKVSGGSGPPPAKPLSQALQWLDQLPLHHPRQIIHWEPLPPPAPPPRGPRGQLVRWLLQVWVTQVFQVVARLPPTPKNSPTEPQVNPAPVPKADPTPSPSSGPPGLDGFNSVQKLVVPGYVKLIFVQFLLSLFDGCVWKLDSQLRREVLQDFVQREFAEIGDIWIQNKIVRLSCINWSSYEWNMLKSAMKANTVLFK